MVSQILSKDVMSVIHTDDRNNYLNEQLGNINKFYFEPFFDEAIPYKASLQLPIKERRELL